MARETLHVPLESARRLAISKQHLQGPLPKQARSESIVSLVREIAFVQWDPVTIVAPSHLISLWNRLGDFRTSDLEKLLWKEKKLLEHWIPIASLVLTEDYPLYSSLMRRYPESLSSSWGAQRTRAQRFLSERSELRKRMLAELRSGPLPLSAFADHRRTKRTDGEWSFGSDVSQMLYHLHMLGEILVVGHDGQQNLWGLAAEFLPNWVVTEPLSADECERQAARRAIRALGTATSSEVLRYFVRGRYADLPKALAALEADGVVQRVHVPELERKEVRFVLSEDVPLLDRLEGGGWQPRLSLLPPFDNLVGNSAYTSRVFGFDYVREQFLPKEKRRFGTYVLPIVYGANFVGRLDARLDKGSGSLEVLSVHAEPAFAGDRSLGPRIAETLDRLGAFLGAEKVVYGPRAPAAWKQSLA